MLRTALSAVAASLPMGAVAWWLTGLWDWSQPGNKLPGALVLIGVVLTAVLVYAACSRLFRSEEAVEFWGLTQRKLRR